MEIPTANLIVSKFVGAVWPPPSRTPAHRAPPRHRHGGGGPHWSIVTAQVDGYGVEVEPLLPRKGPPTAPQALRHHDEGARSGHALLKPGTVLEEIDEAARKVIIDAGYEKYILHRTGHAWASRARGPLRGRGTPESSSPACSSASSRESTSPARAATGIRTRCSSPKPLRPAHKNARLAGGDDVASEGRTRTLKTQRGSHGIAHREEAPPVPRRAAVFTLTVVTLLYVINYMDRMVLSATRPLIRPT